MSSQRQKMGFLGWALAGGVFCGGIPGSGWGSVGAALLGAGAFKIWKNMVSIPDPTIRAKLMPLFLVVGIAGVFSLVCGYAKYSRAFDQQHAK